MKHSLFIAFFLCLGSFASAQQLTSPDGNLSLEFMEQADGVPAYRLDYKGKPVLTSGRLGLLTEEADLFSILEVIFVVKVLILENLLELILSGI